MAKVPIIGKLTTLLPGLSKCQRSSASPLIVEFTQPEGGVVPLAEETHLKYRFENIG